MTDVPATVSDRDLQVTLNSIQDEINLLRETIELYQSTVPEMVRAEVRRIDHEKSERMKTRMKYLIGSIPGGLLTFAIQWLIGG